MSEREEPALAETVTSTTLLEGLKDPADAARWEQWVTRYRSPLVRMAARSGVPAPDAEDVAQNVLMTFATAYRDGRYDRERGRLRSWLFGIARNEIARWRERRATAAGAPVPEPAADGELEALWEEEWRGAVLRRCFELLEREFQPSTLEAFRRFVIAEEPARDVAAALGLSENAVFGAKRRVLRRLRELESTLAEIF